MARFLICGYVTGLISRLRLLFQCSNLWAPLLALFLCLLPFSASSQDERPDLYVLAIAVGDYQDEGIPDLRYADDDARAIIGWAQSQEGGLFRDVYSDMLVDKDATRAQIVSSLVRFFRGARPQDQLVLFFAGHGVVDPETGIYHFLSWDADRSNVAGTAVERGDILEKLGAGDGDRERVLVLVDTCQAGALVEGGGIPGTRSLVPTASPPIEEEKILPGERMWAVFTAGQSPELAVEGPEYRLPSEPPEVEGHGLFTYAILKALTTPSGDTNQSGVLDLNEFKSAVDRTVRQGSNGRQLPRLEGNLTNTSVAWIPGSQERCDGQDNDLDGVVDEGSPDSNGNGVPDCLDEEVCNGIDDNGNGHIDEGFDQDGDGQLSLQLCGDTFGRDCDDNNDKIGPHLRDLPNLIDDDCDERFDEDGIDANGDGLPDSLKKHHTWLSATARGGTAMGAVGVVTSALAYGLLVNLSNNPPYPVDPAAVAAYRRRSALTLAGVGVGALGFGVGLSFGRQADAFELHYLPLTPLSRNPTQP